MELLKHRLLTYLTTHIVGVTIILSYTVRYQAINGVSLDAPVYNKTVDSSLRRASLTDLIKNHNYNISVLASTVKGNGPYSDPIYVMTNQHSK